jgi:hypothetical protein
MKKMKTVFVIDRTTRRATEEVQVQWVLDGKAWRPSSMMARRA